MKPTIIKLLSTLVLLLILQICSVIFIYSSKGIPIHYISIDQLLLIIRVILELFVITTLLFVSFWITNKKQVYIRTLSTVITAYGVFVFQYLVEFTWLLLTKENYSLFEINNFSTFSLLNIVGFEGTPLYLIYPLQTANLWELFFIIVLSALLTKQTKLPLKTILLIILCAYILPLLCWVGFICYTNMLNLV